MKRVSENMQSSWTHCATTRKRVNATSKTRAQY